MTDYVWDNRDRLVEVIDRASAGGAITEDVHYFYDAQNRWIGETISTPGQAVQETSFAYAGNQIVLQFDGTSSTTSSTGFASPLAVANLSHRYLWGAAVDQILAGENVTSLTKPGNVLFPLTNNEGTVCDLAQVNPQTGTTSVVDHRVYDSFGNLVSQTNAAVDFLFGFTGLPTDPATGDVVALNRIYDPVTGTWMSKDPTGVVAGDANAYRYCGNSPANATDPSGLDGQASTYASPTPDPRDGMSTWQSFCFVFVSTTEQQIQLDKHNEDVRLLEGGENAINNGYDRDRYNQLTMSSEQYLAWRRKANEDASSRSILPPTGFNATGVKPTYATAEQAQAAYLADLLSKGEIATAWTVPGGLGENLLVAFGAPGFPILCPSDPAPGLSVYGNVPPGTVPTEFIPPSSPESPERPAEPRRPGYWWPGRYQTPASQHGAYQQSEGRVFPTQRNSGLQGQARAPRRKRSRHQTLGGCLAGDDPPTSWRSRADGSGKERAAGV